MKEILKVVSSIFCVLVGIISFLAGMDNILNGSARFEDYFDFIGPIILGGLLFLSWIHVKKKS